MTATMQTPAPARPAVPRPRSSWDRRRLSDEDAAARLRAYGYEPLAPYPGAAKPWRARCADCGAVRYPTLSNLARGHRRSCHLHRDLSGGRP